MKTSISGVILAVICLTMTILACGLPSNPQAPLPSLTPSTAEADAFEKSFQDAIAQAKNGVFTISVTQEGLSSWLALRAPTLAKQQNFDWPLKNTQAGLSDGKINLYGVLSIKNVPETPTQIIVTPSIDTTGQLAIKIESGQLGIVGVPADLAQNLAKIIQSILTKQLEQSTTSYKLTQLIIKDGTMTLTGQITK